MAPRSKSAPPAKRGGSQPFWWLAVAAVGLLVLAGWWQRSRDPEARPAPLAIASSAATDSSPKWQPQASDADTFAHYAGTATCLECHRERHHAWLQSNHALAEREPSDALDRAAFDPPREFQHGSQVSAARVEGEQMVVRALGPGNEPRDLPVVRVIGHDPLRQFLVDIGGRLQTLEASYDPHRNEWFNVYGEEDRQPGEWGHWTGRGMNWNAMCAACHNTRLRKNYDAATDSYHTAMAERTVSCESCHGPMKDHVLAYKTGTKPAAVNPPT
ncbi:MAG TPA: multiheme c-type cytochrome, partial [Verrucomicrobiae bacterium]|nr:multiheme c-type cytochrome [Verrucomicrobiae bacterium]